MTVVRRFRLGLVLLLGLAALLAFACGVDLVGTDATSADAGTTQTPTLPQPSDTLDGGSLGVVPDADLSDSAIETPVVDAGTTIGDCGASTITDNFAQFVPGAGKWTEYGGVTQGINGSNAYARLILLDTPSKAAGLFWVPLFKATSFKATFSYYARTPPTLGSRGDGMTLTWLTAKDVAPLGTGVVSGQTLGVPPNVSGYAFAFDAFTNFSIGDPSSPSFSILKIDGTKPPGDYDWHIRKSGPWDYVFDMWRSTEVTVGNGKISASVTGVSIFNDQPIDTSSPIVAIGFTAATGGADPIAFFVDTVSITLTDPVCN